MAERANLTTLVPTYTPQGEVEPLVRETLSPSHSSPCCDVFWEHTTILTFWHLSTLNTLLFTSEPEKKAQKHTPYPIP